MRPWVGLLGILMIVSITVAPAKASEPVIKGEISGVEICPQIVCGAAVFTGTFHGVIGRWPTAGFFWTAIQHEELPEPGNTAAILGGKWNISTPLRIFRGTVPEGRLYNNGDNTFSVNAVLELTRGGTGTVNFSGVLDHNDLPPTIEGTLSQ